jgi:hypothetical protein
MIFLNTGKATIKVMRVVTVERSLFGVLLLKVMCRELRKIHRKPLREQEVNFAFVAGCGLRQLYVSGKEISLHYFRLDDVGNGDGAWMTASAKPKQS